MTSDESSDAGAYRTIVAGVCQSWPEHRRFLDKACRQPGDAADILAAAVLRITDGNLAPLIDGYRWMCGMMLEEELHFRRNGRYRFSSFAEVNAAVYQASDVMEGYMDGLLLSQVLWPNHIGIFGFYRDRFLARLPAGRRHLEIGPGHGLLLHYAASILGGTVEAWDISPASLERTAACLKALGSDEKVTLGCKNIMTLSNDGAVPFDSIVLSEVLEHLEEPQAALRNVAQHLAPDGRLFINVPVNSPSIDHIALFRTPEEVATLVTGADLVIEDALAVAAAGYTVAAARKAGVTISYAAIARRA